MRVIFVFKTSLVNFVTSRNGSGKGWLIEMRGGHSLPEPRGMRLSDEWFMQVQVVRAHAPRT